MISLSETLKTRYDWCRRRLSMCFNFGHSQHTSRAANCRPYATSTDDWSNQGQLCCRWRLSTQEASGPIYSIYSAAWKIRCLLSALVHFAWPNCRPRVKRRHVWRHSASANRATAKWMTPFDSAYQIGLLICLRGILIVVWGCLPPLKMGEYSREGG